jgi:predicted metal-dependent peptidase
VTPAARDEPLAEAWATLWRAATTLPAEAPSAALDACLALVRGDRATGAPRLLPSEIARFLEAAQLPASAGVDALEPAWRLLVGAGVAPFEALASLRAWRRVEGVLPTGQMVPDETLAALRRNGPQRVSLPSGHTVSAAEAEAVSDIIRSGNKIDAIKHLRTLTGSGLRDAKEDMDAIGHGAVTWGTASLEDEAPAWSDAQGRRLMDRAVESLLMERPFHWAVLAAARLVEDFTHPTMAVGFTTRGELTLFYNAEFVRSLSPEERMAVLCHEVNHVVLGHLSPPAEAGVNARAWRFACEVTANEFVPWKLPGEPVTRERFSLPAMESTVARYHALATRVLPDPGPPDFILGALRVGATQHGDLDRGAVSYPWRLVQAAADLVGDEIDRETVDSLRAAGGHLAGALGQLLEPDGLGSLRWDELLRQYVAALSARRPTRRWPSRRAPERVGVVPGRRAERERRVVLAAVDTSGSMSDAELNAVAAELAGLTARELRVAYVQCDTEVREQGWLARGATLQRAVGRGGTDLQPPFHPEVLRRYDPSVIVYFTDGYGPAPEAPPPGVDVLWVLTGASPQVPARWGRSVCMKPRAERSRAKPPPPRR